MPRKEKHGMSYTREYKTWCNILQRCNNPSHRDYHRYGGRGIFVEWESFEDFYRDMGDRPSGKHSIERVDNDGPYSAENCIWATRDVQNQNKRRMIGRKPITWNGKTQGVSRWADELGLEYTCLISRIHRGWPIEEAFFGRV